MDVFIRGDRQPATRYTGLRIGLFFFGTGVWLAGVVRENEAFTGAAIVIVLAALLLGLVGRRPDEDDTDGTSDEPA
jgi:hypothetical protein